MDWTEMKCAKVTGTPAPIPLFNPPYPIFSKLWGIIIKQQGILQRDIEIVTKTEQIAFFSHTETPDSFGSGIFSDEATAIGR